MADKEVKVKSDKPSLFKRIGSWFKSLRSESKKISWASWSTVRKGTIIVIVCVIVLSAVLGVIDYLLGNSITALGRLF